MSEPLSCNTVLDCLLVHLQSSDTVDMFSLEVTFIDSVDWFVKSMDCLITLSYKLLPYLALYTCTSFHCLAMLKQSVTV